MCTDERRLFHKEIAALAEDFYNFARGHASVKGADMRHDLCAARSALAAIARDEDVGRKLSVVGMDGAARSFTAESPDELRIAAFYDGKDFSLVVTASALFEGEHNVLVVSAAQSAVRDEEIFKLGIIGDKKAEPAFISRDRAADGAELFGGSVSSAQVAIDFTFARKRAQKVAYCESSFAFKMKFFCDFILCEKGKGAVAYFLKQSIFCVHMDVLFLNMDKS